MSDSDSGIGAFFAGVLIGGLVGAATALLIAPQSGEETRRTLGRYSNDFRDRAQDSIEDARERVKTEGKTGADSLSDAVEAATGEA